MTHLEQLCEHVAIMETEATKNTLAYLFSSATQKAVLEGLVYNVTLQELLARQEPLQRQLLKEALHGDERTNNKTYYKFALQIVPIIQRLGLQEGRF